MNTVNVIIIRTASFTEIATQFIQSWEDNPEGNQQAEQAFLDCIKTLDDSGSLSEDNLDDAITEGWYETAEYHIALTHSTSTIVEDVKSLYRDEPL